MSEILSGYAYTNPAAEELGRFEVLPTDVTAPIPRMLAAAHQEIINTALNERFQGLISPRLVDATANSQDASMVDAQQRRLEEAGRLPGGPQYVHAQFAVPLGATGSAWYMAGIGKVKYADGRPAEARRQDPGAAVNLADISDIYVRPRIRGIADHLQRKGIGSAIARTMLDAYPEDMPAVMYEYPALDPELEPLIESLGFTAAQDRPDVFCGVETTQTTYAGPLCGDVIEALEAQQPWLRAREPVQAPNA